MKAIHKFLNKFGKHAEDFSKNEYKPADLKICRTVYPNDKPTLSPNGTGEWYGLVDSLKK